MGEWQALRPTVSLRCHSTDFSNGFGPGTSRRCRARVFYRRGRGRFCAALLAFPAGYWGDAEMHRALRARCVCRRCHRCSEHRRIRLLSAPRALLDASAGQAHLGRSPRVPQLLGPLPISHVIPPRLFQIVNLQRWNCNVLRRSQKMTVRNYVRHYSARVGGPAVARAVPVLVCSAQACGAQCVACGLWLMACDALAWLRCERSGHPSACMQNVMH